MDATSSNTPSASPAPQPKTPRPPRKIVTYAILTGGILTLLAVLGARGVGRTETGGRTWDATARL